MLKVLFHQLAHQLSHRDLAFAGLGLQFAVFLFIQIHHRSSLHSIDIIMPLSYMSISFCLGSLETDGRNNRLGGHSGRVVLLQRQEWVGSGRFAQVPILAVMGDPNNRDPQAAMGRA